MIPVNTPARRNYNNVGSYNNGFEYKMMPLSFNLQQKGNDNLPNDLNSRFSFNYGDLVQGTCIYDKEEHKGTIINILYDEKTNKPRIAYILDAYSKLVLPIIYSTLYKAFYESLDSKPLKKSLINNKRKSKKMKILRETYSSSTEQMSAQMKAYEKGQKKQDRQAEANKAFAIQVLGKITYNKYANKGTFAPIPLSGLHFLLEDFFYLNPNNKGIKFIDEDDINQMKKFINIFNKISGKEMFRVIDNGVKYVLSSNVVLKRLEDVINFLINIKNTYKTVYKQNEQNLNIVWNSISTKFKKYIH